MVDAQTRWVRAIMRVLDEYYPDPPIPLQHADPYTLLISVLLSARCTDARVNQITPKLFQLASTPQAMVQLSIEQIQGIIRPCGLSPRKARAIWELSEILLTRYGGEVPDDMEALEELPGVGHKTASIVVSQAFGQQAFPVDTHIHRCAKRWGLSNGKSVVQTERDLKRLFPPNSWNKVHLQIIHFARAYCPARGHDSQKCPICSQLDHL